MDIQTFKWKMKDCLQCFITQNCILTIKPVELHFYYGNQMYRFHFHLWIRS